MIYGEKFLNINNCTIDGNLLMIESDINTINEIFKSEDMTFVNEVSIKEIISTIFEKAKKIIISILEWIDKAQAFVSRKLAEFIYKLINFIRSNPEPKKDEKEVEEATLSENMYTRRAATRHASEFNWGATVLQGRSKPVRNDANIKQVYDGRDIAILQEINYKKIDSLIKNLEKGIIDYNAALVSYSDKCVSALINNNQNLSSIKNDEEELEKKFKNFMSSIDDISKTKYEDICKKRNLFFGNSSTLKCCNEELIEHKKAVDNYSKYIKSLKGGLSEVKKFVSSQEAKFKQCSSSISDPDASAEIKNISKNMISKTSEMIKLSLKGCSTISAILNRSIVDIIKSSIIISDAIKGFQFNPAKFKNIAEESETLLDSYVKYDPDQAKSN